jgi:predicted AlkP superfamily phosphohydrolase/phosphomutase/tetratricopeptide (TPR) repeat protein
MDLTPQPGRKVLLIGWDAADWKVIHPLLDSGAMPHLRAAVERGVMADLATLQPVLSPMLWNSIATGHRADRHGILGFSEVDEATGNVRPVSSLSRRVKALWNILSQVGCRTHVFNWYASHPAEPINGVCVTDVFAKDFPRPGAPFPLPAGAVHPPTLGEAMAALRLRPEEVDPTILQLFVPRAAAVDQEKDPRLASIARLVAETICIHNAVTHVLEHEPWDFLAAYYPGIDHFSHGFMTFHPPRLEWVPEAMFELYREVVNGAYRFHDLLLGRLLHLAGPEATLVLLSDHGFHSDHLRPQRIPRVPAGPAVQHRTHGILVMAGPGLKRDERIDGAGLLGIAPTVLTLFGLPAGQDMPGRVFAEAFVTPPSLERIPSWEEVAGPHPDGRHGAGTAYGLSADAGRALLDQFVALGYLDPVGNDPVQSATQTRQEQSWNQAQAHLGAGQHGQAAELLLELVGQRPERGDFVLALAECLAHLGYVSEAEMLVESLLTDRPGWPSAQCLRGSVHLLRRQFAQALARFDEAARSGSSSPMLQTQIGYAFYRMKQYGPAEAAFRRATELDPHLATAHLGLAGCALFLGRFFEAAAHALDAVAWRHNLAVGHLVLGIALEKLGRTAEAAQALRVALSVNPAFGFAHWRLGKLLLQSPATATEGWQQLEAAKKARLEKRAGRRALDEQAALFRQRFSVTLAQARPAWRKLAAAAATAAAAAAAAAATPASASASATTLNPPIVVSGLPRSGTSLMMQMLEAAGVPILTDGQRVADEDNPEGYLEWEPIKTIAQSPERMAEAEGKAVKVISMLLPALPVDRRYRVLFMMRPVAEVAASQAKMLERQQKPGADPSQIKPLLEEHLRAVLNALSRSTHFQTLAVPYRELIADPQPWIEKIVAFLGSDRVPHPERMAGVIRPELHRQKAPPPTGPTGSLPETGR